MEIRHVTPSPAVMPYWNYVKDASPEVKSELICLLTSVPDTSAKTVVNIEDDEVEIEDRLVFPQTREEEIEILRRAFLNAKKLKEGKLKTHDFWEVINEL